MPKVILETLIDEKVTPILAKLAANTTQDLVIKNWATILELDPYAIMMLDQGL